MPSPGYISPQRVIRKKLQRLTLEIKKHIHRYRSSLVIVIAVLIGMSILGTLYRYFLGSQIWSIQDLEIDPQSKICYPDPELYAKMTQIFQGYNFWKATLGGKPDAYLTFNQQYPLIGDTSFTINDGKYSISYKCIKPSMIWMVNKHMVASWSGIFLPIQVSNPLSKDVMIGYLPDYITGYELSSMYHVISEAYIQKSMHEIARLFQPAQQTYLIGSDKIQILTRDQKLITLSMSQSLAQQHYVIQRLQKHYFQWRLLKEIDCSNLQHIVVKP